MFILEGGGEFKCRTHDFTTTDIEAWNDHCDGDPIHNEHGETACVLCGEKLYFKDLPYHRIGPDGSKNIALKCDDCHEKSHGNVKISKKGGITE